MRRPRRRPRTAVWHHPGMRGPVRWVLVRDVEGEREPQAFLCTDPAVEPVTILGWLVRRWRCETTFEEARRHLGVANPWHEADPSRRLEAENRAYAGCNRYEFKLTHYPRRGGFAG